MGDLLQEFRGVIIQARMGSTRLPGKVLLPLGGKPMLTRMIERLRRCKTVARIIVATTTLREDDPIEQLAREQGVLVHRAPRPDDVVQRLCQAMKRFELKEVVRLTADCPLIDPAIVDDMADTLGAFEYTSNVYPGRDFPRGMDCEAMQANTLWKLNQEAAGEDREHVTSLIHRQPRAWKYSKWNWADNPGGAQYRWTVDYPEDLRVVRAIWNGMKLGERWAGYREILKWYQNHPELHQINAHLEHEQQATEHTRRFPEAQEEANP